MMSTPKSPKNAQKPVHCPSLLLLQIPQVITNRAATLMAVIPPFHSPTLPTFPQIPLLHISTSTFLSPIKHPNISSLSSNKCGRMSRQWAIHLFPLPFLLLLIQLSLKERATLATDIVEFLFQNQRICGEPFADAQWVPVLDLCELECKADEEVCMEDDQMKQSCRKLPTECTRAFRAQQPANLHKGMVQIGKKTKEEQNQPAKLPSSSPRPAVIGKNSVAAIAATSKGGGEVNSLMRGARRKKQSRRKLRANAGGKTRQIAKSASATGGKNGRMETKKIAGIRSRRNEKGKKPRVKGGEMRLRQRQWRGIMRRRKKQNGRN